MSEAELIEYIKERVNHYKGLYNLGTGQAFMLWYAIEAMNLDQDVAFEVVAYDGGNDKSIDMLFIDEEFERVVIGQGKYNAKGQYKPTVGEFLELLHTIDWLRNPEDLQREGREDLAAAAVDFNDAVTRGYSIEYVFVYMGVPKRELIDAANQFNAREAGNIPTQSARIISLDLLHHIHDEYINQATRIAKETITIPLAKSFELNGSYGKALVVSVSGPELRRLYATHQDALFDRNVRLFLGARKGGVNAGIQETLDSPTERTNFWAYNNGITFICDRYDLDQVKNTVTLYNLSIVNGCQTTVSIAHASERASKDVSVMARIIASPQEAVVNSITTYTNRQNPIQPWNINSQDKLQKRLKKELAEGSNPYFYILRPGEMSHLTPSERRTFTRHGKLQTIPYDVIAQYHAAFRGIPVVAYKDKSRLFTAHRDTVFPSDIKVEQLILAWEGGQVAEDVVRRALLVAAQGNNQEDVRILKLGGKLFVLAVMAVILNERNGLTFLRRLKREVVSSNRTKQRLERYAQLALIWYIQAVKDLISQGIPLSQIVRSEEMFLRIRDKVLTNWKVQSMSQSWVDDALPKL